MFMILFILNNPDECQSLLNAWEDAGAPGVTILPSSGLGRVRRRTGLKEDMPLMPSLEDFFHQEENLHRTLFTIVAERDVVDRIIQVTQSMFGDLNLPDTGILAVLPVLEVHGLRRHKA
jgi:nitrogen regulatory protein P-II 1